MLVEQIPQGKPLANWIAYLDATPAEIRGARMVRPLGDDTVRDGGPVREACEAAVLEVLQASERGLSIQDLEEATGFSGNTVRKYMDALLCSGAVFASEQSRRESRIYSDRHELAVLRGGALASRPAKVRKSRSKKPKSERDVSAVERRAQKVAAWLLNDSRRTVSLDELAAQFSTAKAVMRRSIEWLRARKQVVLHRVHSSLYVEVVR